MELKVTVTCPNCGQEIEIDAAPQLKLAISQKKREIEQAQHQLSEFKTQFGGLI